MTVVVGYVPTREGRAALQYAVAEAVRRRTGLVVVSGRGNDRVGEGQLEGDLAGYEADLADSGVQVRVRRLGDGDGIAEELLAIAEDAAAELIVIGLRRRSPVGKLLLGSHAQRVLLDANCPVLAVKGAVSAG